MLHALNDRVKYCYARAAGCRERAQRERYPAAKETWHRMEDRWLKLALSIELTESISDFHSEVSGFLERRNAELNVLQRAAFCSSCGKQMRLISSEPHKRVKDVDLYCFICDCGHSTETYVYASPSCCRSASGCKH
jgi:hypothetical protein